MTPLHFARLMMTVILAGSAIASFLLDWSRNHLFNPLWHPHARFHGALLLFFLAGVAGTGLWMLWRPSKEPVVAVRATAALALSFWTPLFYITSVLPGSTSWAGMPGADPRLAGSVVTPNLVVAAVVAALIVIAAGIAGRSKALLAPSAARCAE